MAEAPQGRGVETPKTKTESLTQEVQDFFSGLKDKSRELKAEAAWNTAHGAFDNLQKQIESGEISYQGRDRIVRNWADAYKDLIKDLEQSKENGADVSDLEAKLPEILRGILKIQVSRIGSDLLTILQVAKGAGIKISDIDDGTLSKLRATTEEIKK